MKNDCILAKEQLGTNCNQSMQFCQSVSHTLLEVHSVNEVFRPWVHYIKNLDGDDID